MKLLKQLYQISSKSGFEGEIKEFIKSYIKDMPLKVDEDEKGNIYITKGVADRYVCLAAHLDEVHDPCSRTVVVDGDKIYTVDREGNRVGCGADDKNGIWVALNLLQTESALKVIFFVEEEKVGEIAGCRGARVCDLSFFDDAVCVLECDRKGATDVVRVGKEIVLCEEDFIPSSILSKYGYAMVEGGKTDVVELKMRGLQLPVCNISCGYYEAHTNDEFTLYSELQNCLHFVEHIKREI